MSFYFSAYQRTCNGQVGGAGVYKMHVGHLSQHYTEGSSDSEESLFFLCVYVFICTMTVQVPAETRGLDSLELELQAAVTHRAWILCKSSNCPKLLSHLSSPWMTFNETNLKVLEITQWGSAGCASMKACAWNPDTHVKPWAEQGCLCL